jgi:hypothetical protein
VRRGADGLGRGCSESPSKRQTDMAPQVLRNVRPEITAFQLGAVLKDRPLLASLVAQIIEQWAWIDAVINGMLADFLRLDIVIATKMLQAVENQSARTAMVRAAAQHALPSSDFQIFEATLQTTRASERRRNAFAHHLWAEPFPEGAYGDALLLLDPKVFNRNLAEEGGAIAVNSLLKPSQPMSAQHDWWAEIYLYAENDFRESLDDALRAHSVIRTLRDFVRASQVRDVAATDSIRGLLSKEPLIRQRLDTVSARNSQQPP